MRHKPVKDGAEKSSAAQDRSCAAVSFQYQD